MNLHATCVAIDGRGVLLRGPAGGGKSDLALRLIDQYTDAILVADDRVDLAVEDGALYASPPPRIAGLLEVRGVGIVRMGFCEKARLYLLADMARAEDIARLPEPAYEEILGLRVARIALAPFEASAPARLRQALRLLKAPEMDAS